MANELILNVTLGEARVARLENGVVSELYIERAKEQGVVGNVYKGKVVRVLPGMQAAFVDIGLERTAFLHASDVVQELTRFDVDIDDDAFDVTLAGIGQRHPHARGGGGKKRFGTWSDAVRRAHDTVSSSSVDSRL